MDSGPLPPPPPAPPYARTAAGCTAAAAVAAGAEMARSRMISSKRVMWCDRKGAWVATWGREDRGFEGLGRGFDRT